MSSEEVRASINPDELRSIADLADELQRRLSALPREVLTSKTLADPARIAPSLRAVADYIDCTCQLLDVVDEITDPVTAGLITDVIYERLTGDGASEAAQRIRDARADGASRQRAVPAA